MTKQFVELCDSCKFNKSCDPGKAVIASQYDDATAELVSEDWANDGYDFTSSPDFVVAAVVVKCPKYKSLEG